MRAFRRNIILICLSFFFSGGILAQSSFNIQKDYSKKIRFQLINNLIILPVEINGVELSFVLDTGVSKPILFNLVNTDSLQIKNVETIYLRGLGAGGSIQALRSKHNFFKIGDAINVNQDVYVVFDDAINFTARLGVPVHGIIGYDLFKDFVVEVNYSYGFIRLYKAEKFKYKTSKKWITMPLTLYKKKPYIDAYVAIEDEEELPVRLLIDTGGSDALWLFEDDKIGPPKDLQFDDYLGKGLSGAVYGKRSKAKNFALDVFQLKDVNVAFPDSVSLSVAKNYKQRNGSISGNVLKRFNMFFDYKNNKLQLRRNGNFSAPFFYNNSGITLEQRGFRVVREEVRSGNLDAYESIKNNAGSSVDYALSYKYSLRPAFEIVELRSTSNAKAAGLQIGDVILSINNKPTQSLSLNEINKFFHDKEGKLIRLKIERDGHKKLFHFRLDNVFKKKSLPLEDSK